jgi:pilus assembly protein CpaB
LKKSREKGFGVRVNTLVTLGASAAFGVLAIVIARGWVDDAVNNQFRQNKSDAVAVSKPAYNTVPVLVADLDLSFGDQLTPQSVRLVEYPEDALPAGSFTDFDKLFVDINNPTVALMNMVANEPVLDFKISGPGGRGSLSAIIAENMRAVTIRVNDITGVGGFIVPADHVDIMLTRSENPAEPDGDKITSLLVQNLKVLGTGQNNNQQSAAPSVVKAVTLETTNEQAQKLILAMSVGKLSLTLRRAGETADAEATQVTLESLNALAAAQKVARKNTGTRKSSTGTYRRKPNPAGSTASVTVIRDGSRTKEKVKKEPTQEPQMAGGSL